MLMPKSPNQKKKLLVLRDLLLKHSDEEHPITIKGMIDELERHDIKAERKSLYDDMETLRSYGLDVQSRKGTITRKRFLSQAPFCPEDFATYY